MATTPTDASNSFFMVCLHQLLGVPESSERYRNTPGMPVTGMQQMIANNSRSSLFRYLRLRGEGGVMDAALADRWAMC
jgi:hypothetical protein